MNKLNHYIFFFALLNVSSYAFAKAETVSYSPYADLTINTYWDASYQDMEPMNLAAISTTTGISSYHLAFITDAGNCLPAWGAQATYAVTNQWGKHLTDKLKAANTQYIIAFGGASGNDLSLACSDQALLAAYQQVITTYAPQGLDFDIENGSAKVTKIMSVLKNIQAHYPDLKISFTLPTLPEGLVSQGEEI